MKKLLIISEVFWPENFIVNDLVTQLKNRGFTVDILSQYPSYPEGKVFENYTNSKFAIEEWEGSKIYRFKVIEGYRDSKIKKILNYLYFVRAGRRLVRKMETKYDAVVVVQSGPMTVVLPGITYAKRNGVKLYHWMLDIWPDALYAYGFKHNFITNWVLKRFLRHVYASSEKLFISSKNFRDTVLEYTSKDKQIHYMPNWNVESQQDKSTVVLDKNYFNITFTGNISLYQNLENVIRGFALSQVGDCILNIVGDGSKLDTLKQLVEKDNIKNVIFWGRHPASQMHDILLQSDALLLPLISNEGIQKTEPFKIQSYLKSAKPILGVIGGAGKEIIIENKLGLCANPDDLSEIANCFKCIKQFSKQNSQTVAENAEKLLSNRFKREKIIDGFVEQIIN